MKTLIPLSSLAALAAANAPAPASPWTAGAWRPTEDTPRWFGEAIQANGGRFWIGKDPSAYCPSGINGLDCSHYPGDRTVFVNSNTTTTFSLNVAVPGGQQVYIAPDGALSYTVPHSASKPDGSITEGFYRVISDSGGAPVVWGFTQGNMVACSVADSPGVFQIFVSINSTHAGCAGFQARSYSLDGIVAWEY